MSSDTYKLLDAEVQKRAWDEGVATLNLMAALYEGNLPDQYKRYFPRGDPATVINMIKLAWDDLSVSVGKWPDLKGQTMNHSDKELKRVGLFERICHSYLHNSEPNGKLFMRELGWWLVGGGRSVVIIKPDLEKQGPIFETRDPRYCYPKGRQTSLGQFVEMNDILMKYELDVDVMKEMGLEPAQRKAKYGGTPIIGKPAGPDTAWVIEYVDKNQWVIASDGGTVQRVDHNLGVVPGWVFQTIAPDSKAGLSAFKDQVNLMVSISRMFSGKMAIMDRLINPVYWVKGHEGAVKIGPHVLNKLGPQGEMGQIAPPATVQVDRDIQQLTQFSRILNRNPEVRQGEISAKSTYTSAKTLEQLSESIDTVVGGFWDVISVGMQVMFRVALEMDEALWPDAEKSIQGIVKGRSYMDKYVPSKDIAGRRFIRVDHGFGVGGYQGFLMHIQANDAGMMPKRTVIEAMPGQADADAAMRQIELDKMDDAGAALFMQQAATGEMDTVLWSMLRKEMADKGLPLHEAILKYKTEIQAQAQQAQPQGGAGALTVPGAPEEPPVEEAPAPPGIPPSVFAGV